MDYVEMSAEESSLAPKARARLPTLPVKLLKRRKQVNKDVIKQQRKRSTEIRKRAQKQKQLFHRPAFFISRARRSARDESRLLRSTKKRPPIEVPNRERLGIVIRIFGDSGLAPESYQILSLLRLHSKNQAVFVPISQAMLELLATVKPYVVWGYADLATTRNLIFKRGKTRVGGKTKSLTNALVEEKLGQFGLICIEDIIHELTSLGPHLRDVLGFLAPFQVRPPTGDWIGTVKKTHHSFNQRSGNRSEFISQLVNKMV
uniref:60S ribosomal protein L7 n=2 Tax=Schistocephalus solidus TaxID=70667 RepID=A0A0V0J9H4_SCHSO